MTRLQTTRVFSKQIRRGQRRRHVVGLCLRQVHTRHNRHHSRHHHHHLMTTKRLNLHHNLTKNGQLRLHKTRVKQEAHHHGVHTDNSPENDITALLLVKQNICVPGEFTMRCVTPQKDVCWPFLSLPKALAVQTAAIDSQSHLVIVPS